MCPPPTIGAFASWWCGNETILAPCQTAITGSASFVGHTAGSVLGVAPLTPVSTTQAITTTVGVSSVSASVTSSPGPTTIPPTLCSTVSTTAPNLSQAPHQASQTATAVGAGIGVPLGIAVMGLLGFLFWRELRWKEMARSPKSDWVNSSSEPREVPDSQIPWELDHRAGKVELPTAQLGAR
ncbi:hypothetical protein MMC28_007751 [Mycoblastus sanguinarius]|nr:hypothetical protein [Mycoblastus sanguinarius]